METAGQLVAAWAPNVGVGGVIVGAIIALFKGWLVPGTTVDRMTRQWEQQLADAKQETTEWRAAHGVSEAARERALLHSGELLETARTVERLLLALPRPSGEAP